MENGLQKLGVVRRMELWSERVQECRSSGKSVREWCRDKGLSEKTYACICAHSVYAVFHRPFELAVHCIYFLLEVSLRSSRLIVDGDRFSTLAISEFFFP